jgi:hypothetical protein
MARCEDSSQAVVGSSRLEIEAFAALTGCGQTTQDEAKTGAMAKKASCRWA